MRFSLTQAMLAVALSLTILSCDKDDDDNPAPSPTPVVATKQASYDRISPRGILKAEDLPIQIEVEFSQEEGLLDSIYVSLDSTNQSSQSVIYYQKGMRFTDSVFNYTFQDSVVLPQANRSRKSHHITIYADARGKKGLSSTRVGFGFE